MPKIVAAILVIPLLVCVAALVSIIGAYLAAVPTGLFSTADYIKGIRSFFVPYNVFMMLSRPSFLPTSLPACLVTRATT
jgi:phospholipid/cholesterol/gamma-HCH transport system permease protein